MFGWVVLGRVGSGRVESGRARSGGLGLVWAWGWGLGERGVAGVCFGWGLSDLNGLGALGWVRLVLDGVKRVEVGWLGWHAMRDPARCTVCLLGDPVVRPHTLQRITSAVSVIRGRLLLRSLPRPNMGLVYA